MIYRKGFTLIELIIVLVIVGIVIQMGYSMLIYGNNTFNLSTSRGLSQQNVRLVESVLSDEFKTISNLSTSESDFNSKYFSLKFENGELIKSYHVQDESGNIVSTIVTKFQGSWDTIKIINTDPGVVDLVIGQAEVVGNITSRYELPLRIYTVNNNNLESEIDVDLLNAGTVVYYQHMYDYLSQQSNAMSVDIRDSTSGGGTPPEENDIVAVLENTASLEYSYTVVNGNNTNTTVVTYQSGVNSSKTLKSNEKVKMQLELYGTSLNDDDLIIDITGNTENIVKNVNVANDKIVIDFDYVIPSLTNNTDHTITVEASGNGITSKSYIFSFVVKNNW